MTSEHEHGQAVKTLTKRIETLQEQRELALAMDRGDAGELRSEIDELARRKDDHEAALRGLRRLKQNRPT